MGARATLTRDVKFGPALWIDDRFVARVCMGPGATAADVIDASRVTPGDPIPQWEKDALTFVHAVNAMERGERQQESEVEWLLRQMETQPLATLRDIATSYPTERSQLPIVEITRVTVIVRRHACDLVSLYTKHAECVYPYKDRLSLNFNAASGTGVALVKQMFGIDAEAIQG